MKFFIEDFFSKCDQIKTFKRSKIFFQDEVILEPSIKATPFNFQISIAWEYFYPRGITYILGNKYWESSFLLGEKDWVSAFD